MQSQRSIVIGRQERVRPDPPLRQLPSAQADTRHASASRRLLGALILIVTACSGNGRGGWANDSARASHRIGPN